MKLHTSFLISSFLLPFAFYSQTGPGGVGNSTNNNLWLRADAGTFTDAGVTPAAHTNQVQQWNDQSGNGRNATQTTAGNRPLYHLNAANGRPGLRYTGNMFIDPPALGLANNGSYTYILTFRDTVTGIGAMTDGNGHFILDRTSATNALVSLKPTTGNFYGYQKRNDAGGGLGGPLTTTSINTNVKSIQMRRNFNVNYQIFYNAALQATLADANGNTTPPNPRIGRHATTTNGGIRGFIYEFIIYNFALNTAQTIIINNYLGAKYGYLLTINDLYIQDNPANGDYDYEVAGIGQVDATNLHSDAQGTGIVRMLNPTNLNDDEFLLWGHDNGVAGAVHYTDIPSSVDARFDRVWRVSEVNASGTSVDVGGVDMRWDLNGLGAITVTDLRLLVDTDNDGLFADETPKGGAIDLGGGIYEFSNVTELTDNVRFTIATINSVQTPLPIELVNFDARPISNEVLVSWQTASEINNDYFTIEKSTDGENWTIVTEIDGAGNSTALLSYQTSDKSPYTGLSYYRLKQTDFDGHYSYSEVKTVRFELPVSKIRVNPNPSSDFITVYSAQLLDKTPQILSINGQNVTAICTLNRLNSASLSIDIRNLSAGVYILSIGDQHIRIIKN